jgi:hypothetical protein
LLCQAIGIISREASQLVTQVSGEAAHEKRHKENARRFAGGRWARREFMRCVGRALPREGWSCMRFAISAGVLP